VENLVFSMQCHIHMHMILHGAMYGMWRNWFFARDLGARANAVGALRCGLGWFLWQFRNLHIPQRGKTRANLFAKQ
jgi:hypothetical protein